MVAFLLGLADALSNALCGGPCGFHAPHQASPALRISRGNSGSNARKLPSFHQVPVLVLLVNVFYIDCCVVGEDCNLCVLFLGRLAIEDRCRGNNLRYEPIRGE